MEAGEYSFYRVLNQVLRDEDRRNALPWFAFLRVFDSALSKLPTVRACVWRGVSFDVSELYQKNQIVTWWNVSSCSLSVRVVEAFLKSNDSATLFMIEAVHGGNMSGYTMYSDEEEVILHMSTRLRVKDNALKYGTLSVVHLVEVDSQEQDQIAAATPIPLHR